MCEDPLLVEIGFRGAREISEVRNLSKTFLASVVLGVCVVSPVWSQNNGQSSTAPQPVSLTPATVASTTIAAPVLPQPPQPPGLPVPTKVSLPAMTTPPKVDLTKPLTIEDALCIAFASNPDIKIAADVAQRAVGVVNEARANFNPRFNLQVQQLQQPEVVSQFGGAQGQRIVIQNPSSTTASLAATLPLDISNRLALTTDLARYQFDVQYLNMVAASERLIQGVKVAYYDLLRANGQAKVAQAAVDVAQVRLANTRARFEAGTAPRFDVTTAEVDLENLNQQLIQAQTRVETARSAFNRQLGLDINTQTTIQDIVPAVEVNTVDIDSNIKTAYERRPEVRAGRAGVVLSQTNVRLQQTGLRPSLSVNFNTGYNVNTTTLANQNVNWQAIILLQQPVWDGGVTRARVQQARADVANAADTLDQVKLNVGVDVRNAILSLEEAARRTKTTAAAVSLAEEALRLANVRYEAGIAVLVEVTNAESQLTQARFNYVNAQYDYAAAMAALQRATSTQPELNQVQLLNNARLKS